MTNDALPVHGISAALLGARADETLTDEDVATLQHLVREGLGRNTLRALRSDLEYLEAWSLACTGDALEWPPSRNTILRFVAHHLWDPDERARNPAHGMPQAVETILRRGAYLKADGPHAPATVRRRLSSWRTLCRWREAGDPFDDPVVRKTVAAAVRTAARPRGRKSPDAVDGTLIGRLMDHLSKTCAPCTFPDRELERIRCAALRDRAMLALAFASGGRRRSEISRLTLGALTSQPDIPDPDTGEMLPSLAVSLGRTKTTDADDDTTVYVSGAPVRFVAAWIDAAQITSGPLFRRIDRWGHISKNGIGEQGLNLVLKSRIREIGEDPRRFSAHGIRSGYITEALNRGLTPQEIMGQTQHRSMKTTLEYYNARQRRTGRAARLLS